MEEEGLPPMAEMLDDLSKVDGMAGWFSIILAALKACPQGIVSNEEMAVLERGAGVQNDSGLTAETGDSEQKSGSVVDSVERTLTPYFKPET